MIRSLPKKVKNQGPREVRIRTSNGGTMTIVTGYYSQKGRKIGRRKRAGIRPELILLGIYDHCTPALASEISVMAAMLSSFEETRHILEDRGIKMDADTIRTVSVRCARRARAVHEAGEGNFPETVAGCRVVISTDGGRVRIRRDKRGPKTKKGRSHYSTKWREPKLLIIYTVNEHGERSKTFSPFIDGTLRGPNAVFGLIGHYLRRLDICRADRILFVADGARWIWNRVRSLMISLGVSPGQYHELLDFYHAAEHLGKVANLQKGWKASERKTWVRRQRRLLLRGRLEEVTDAIRRVCKGRRGKKLRTERNYFIRNRKRMCYDKISDMGLPIGSGAMESAIRRVVNLRLKGASSYWLRENAEAMILLRSYYKAGRWDMLKASAFSAQSVHAT